MAIGSLGILYWSGGKAFTTPFIVTSEPDPNEVVPDVWPEEWVMPFQIIALGTPRKMFPRERQ